MLIKDFALAMGAQNTKVLIDLQDSVLDQAFALATRKGWLPDGRRERIAFAQAILAAGVLAVNKYGQGGGDFEKYLKEVLGDIPSELAKRIVAPRNPGDAIIAIPKPTGDTSPTTHPLDNLKAFFDGIGR